jgi:hypothetical protein
MVDRSGHPFGVLIWGVHFDSTTEERGGWGNDGCRWHGWAARRRGHRNGASVVGSRHEGSRRAHDDEERATVLGAGGGEWGEGEEL